MLRPTLIVVSHAGRAGNVGCRAAAVLHQCIHSAATVGLRRGAPRAYKDVPLKPLASEPERGSETSEQFLESCTVWEHTEVARASNACSAFSIGRRSLPRALYSSYCAVCMRRSLAGGEGHGSAVHSLTASAPTGPTAAARCAALSSCCAICFDDDEGVKLCMCTGVTVCMICGPTAGRSMWRHLLQGPVARAAGRAHRRAGHTTSHMPHVYPLLQASWCGGVYAAPSYTKTTAARAATAVALHGAIHIGNSRQQLRRRWWRR